MMIVGEIADKMLPGPFYVLMAVALGAGMTAAFVFARGLPRIAMTLAILIPALFAKFLFQIDSGLPEATTRELGQAYVFTSRYWMLVSIAAAILATAVIRFSPLHAKLITEN